MENIPSACVLYSIEHTKDDGLPEPLPRKALTFMASKEMKGKPLEQTAPLFLKDCQMTKRPSCKSGSWNQWPEHKWTVVSAEGWKSNSFQLPHIPHIGTAHSQPERPQWQETGCRWHGLSIIEAKCPYLVRNDNLHVKAMYDRVDFLEDFNGKPRLKRTHNCTQIKAQMWVVGASYGYFIVWTQGGPLFYELVELEFCLNFFSNITLFYKSFVLPCLLGYRDIFECPKCSKVILEEDEISDSAKDNCNFCDSCSTW